MLNSEIENLLKTDTKMKIEQINNYNTNFQAKFLPKKLCQNITDLKTRMECDTVILRGQDFNQVISTRGLSINNGEAIFKNGKFLAKRDKNNKLVPYGTDTAMIEFGKVRIISKDNGEIIEHKKPFFKKWNEIIEQADKYIRCALENYSNESIVTKISNKKDTLNENGKKQAQKVMEIFDSLNPFSNK